jgi:hypothetical protein
MVHEPIELKIASDKFRSLIDLAIAQREATILIPETNSGVIGCATQLRRLTGKH